MSFHSAYSDPRLVRYYMAKAGDYYWMHVSLDNDECFIGRDIALGLKRGVYCLEIAVEAINPDTGVITESVWVSPATQEPLTQKPPGKGWEFVRFSADKLSQQWRRDRLHKIVDAKRTSRGNWGVLECMYENERIKRSKFKTR